MGKSFFAQVLNPCKASMKVWVSADYEGRQGFKGFKGRCGWRKSKGWKMRKIPGGFFGGVSFTYVYIYIWYIYIHRGRTLVWTYGGEVTSGILPTLTSDWWIIYCKHIQKVNRFILANCGLNWQKLLEDTFSPRAYEEDFQIWPSLACNWQDSSTNQLAESKLLGDFLVHAKTLGYSGYTLFVN